MLTNGVNNFCGIKTKKKVMKKLSDYELSELGNLLAELQNRINDYRHISEFVPMEVKNSIETAFDEVITEENARKR